MNNGAVAKNSTRLFIDRNYQIIDYQEVGDGGVGLARAMVREAERNGGRYSRKLAWFWKAAKDAGWDEDEVAWWILSGSYHELRMKQDLREVF